MTSIVVDPGGANEATMTLVGASQSGAAGSDTYCVYGYLRDFQIPPGPVTVRFTLSSGTVPAHCWAGVTVFDVDQGSPIGNVETTGDEVASTSLSDSITVAANSLVLNQFAGNAEVPAADGTQTEVETGTATVSSTDVMFGLAFEAFATSGAKNLGWTFTSQTIKAMSLVEIKVTTQSPHQQQLRHDTLTAVAAYTGPPGEVVVVNETSGSWRNRVVVQDGVTQGGWTVHNFKDLIRWADRGGTTTNAINDYTLDLGSGLPLKAVDTRARFAVRINSTNTGAARFRIKADQTYAYADVKKLNAQGVKVDLVAGDLAANWYYDLLFDGTDWLLIGGGAGGGGMWDLLERNDITSNVSDVVLETGDFTLYDKIRIDLDGVEKTASSNLLVRLSDDGGSSFIAGTNYGKVNSLIHNSGASFTRVDQGSGASGDTAWEIMNTQVAPVDAPISGFLEISRLSEATQHIGVFALAWPGSAASDTEVRHNAGGLLYSTGGTETAKDAIQVVPDSGSLQDGVISLWGQRKS